MTNQSERPTSVSNSAADLVSVSQFDPVDGVRVRDAWLAPLTSLAQLTGIWLGSFYVDTNYPATTDEFGGYWFAAILLTALLFVPLVATIGFSAAATAFVTSRAAFAITAAAIPAAVSAILIYNGFPTSDGLDTAGGRFAAIVVAASIPTFLPLPWILRRRAGGRRPSV